jgi:predicted O-methyltransferase YrrM
MKHITNKEQTWMRDKVSTEALLDLIKELGDNSDKRMIEIGSFVGESTVLFAQSFGSVTAIDPFMEGYDNGDTTSYQFDFSNVYETYIERTKDYTNIKTLKITSDEGYKVLKYNEFDFVYIDGVHTYDQVKKDIQNYLPFIKKGGVIGGHDYVQGWSGVMKAVDEVLGKPDKTFKDGSWIKYL